MEDWILHLPSASKIANSVVLAAIAVGIHYRHRRKIHIPIMLSCFVLDVINLVVIELNRGAIKKAIATATTGGDWILKFHISVSVIFLVCYVIAIITGIRLHRTGKGRATHRKNAAVFLLARVLNYVTSFYV